MQDWKRLGILIAALVVFAIVNPFLGYVVSATLLFGDHRDRARCAATGRRRSPTGSSWPRSVFLLFDVLIGISLPAGIWGF